jgi:hypothetical protein
VLGVLQQRRAVDERPVEPGLEDAEILAAELLQRARLVDGAALGAPRQQDRTVGGEDLLGAARPEGEQRVAERGADAGGLDVRGRHVAHRRRHALGHLELVAAPAMGLVLDRPHVAAAGLDDVAAGAGELLVEVGRGQVQPMVEAQRRRVAATAAAARTRDGRRSR